MSLNRDSYNAIALQWDRARLTLSNAERNFLDLLLRDLPPQSRVLDLGCGTGRPMAEYVLNAGHIIYGVDQSHALLELARSRFPRGEWIESTLEDFVPPATFAAAIAWDSLFHIPRAHHAAIFERVCNALPSGARFMLTVGGSAHPAFTDEMFGHTFAYDSHTPREVMKLLTDVGFDIEHSEFLNVPTEGRDKGRFGIVARVKSGSL